MRRLEELGRLSSAVLPTPGSPESSEAPPRVAAAARNTSMKFEISVPSGQALGLAR